MSFKNKTLEDQILLLQAFKMATRQTSKNCAKYLKCGEISFSNWITGKTRMGDLERSVLKYWLSSQVPGLGDFEPNDIFAALGYPLPEDIVKKLSDSWNNTKNQG